MDGPWFDELSVGDRFEGAPSVTLTSGHAAVHQAVLGDRLRSPLDDGLAQACRAIPNIVTVVAWENCDHLGPVHEGGTLTSEIEVLAVDGHLVTLRSVVDDVLDWRFTVVMT